MLTDAQRADGWIEHDGGVMPVAGDVTVEVLLRSARGRFAGRDKAQWFSWPHMPQDADNDIIAYRKEPTP